MLRPTPVPRPLESTDTQTRTDGQCWLEAAPPFPSALRGKNGQLSPNTAFPGARLVRTGRALGVGALGLTQRAGLEREGCCPFCSPQLLTRPPQVSPPACLAPGVPRGVALKDRKMYSFKYVYLAFYNGHSQADGEVERLVCWCPLLDSTVPMLCQSHQRPSVCSVPAPGAP